MTVVESLSCNETHVETMHRYIYRLVKNSVELPANSSCIQVQSYGIEIERHDIEDGEIINIERETVKSISPHRYKVHNILKMLYDNVVSPIHLVEVIGELVDEYVLDYDKILKETNIN